LFFENELDPMRISKERKGGYFNQRKYQKGLRNTQPGDKDYTGNKGTKGGADIICHIHLARGAPHRCPCQKIRLPGKRKLRSCEKSSCKNQKEKYDFPRYKE